MSGYFRLEQGVRFFRETRPHLLAHELHAGRQIRRCDLDGRLVVKHRQGHPKADVAQNVPRQFERQFDVRNLFALPGFGQGRSNPLPITDNEEGLKRGAEQFILQLDTYELGGGGVDVLDLAFDDEKQTDGIRFHKQPESLLCLGQIPLHPLVIRHIVDEQMRRPIPVGRLHRRFHKPKNARRNFQLDFARTHALRAGLQSPPIAQRQPLGQISSGQSLAVVETHDGGKPVVALGDLQVHNTGNAIHG